MKRTSKEMPRGVVIYSRCNPHADNVEISNSAQEEVCREMAVGLGYEGLAAFRDTGSDKDESREGLDELTRFWLQNLGQVVAIIVLDTSRLTSDIFEFTEMQQKLSGNGIAIIVVDSNEDNAI